LYDVEVTAAAESPAFLSETTTKDEMEISLPTAVSAVHAMVLVRAHSARATHKQMIIGWSNFSDPVRCTRGTNTGQSLVTAARTVALPVLARSGPLATDSIALQWRASAGGVSGSACRVEYTLMDTAAEMVAIGAFAQWTVVAVSAAAVDGLATMGGLMPGSTYAARLRCAISGSASVTSNTIAISTATTYPITVRTGRPDTSWIEVFRVSENFVLTPDFLANHNSGSIEGDVGFMTGCGDPCKCPCDR
jgi:hypothetical protein